MKKQKRAERIKARPHPFPAFRTTESTADDDDDDEIDVQPVAHYFDAVELTAKCLRSDGSFGFQILKTYINIFSKSRFQK